MLAFVIVTDDDGSPSEASPTSVSEPVDASSTSSVATTSTTTSVPAPGAPPRWMPLGEPGVGGRLTSLAVDPSDDQHVLLGGDLLGVASSDDGGASWTRSEGLLGLEVSRFTFHPDRPEEVWVGTMSGPHVSTDGGRTWEPRREGLPPVNGYYYTAPVEVVLFDQGTAERLLAFGGSRREWQSQGEPAWGAVWESLDGGATWSEVGTIADGTNVLAVVQLDDGALLAAALDQGVHRSDDGGRTWTRVGGGLPHWNVRDLAVGGGTVYAALGAGPLDGDEHMPGSVFRSDDGGLTWSGPSDGLGDRRATTPEHTSRYDTVVVSPTDPETLWTADLAFGIEAVYRSDDGGDTWRVELPGDADVDTAYSSPITAEVLVADATRSELRFLAQSEYVLRRTEDGSWVDATSVGTPGARAGTGYSGLVATDVTFDLARPGYIGLNALDGGQYLRSEDDGATWDRPLTSWDQWGGGQSMTVAGPDGMHTYVLLGQFDLFNGIASSSDGEQTWDVAVGAEDGLPERAQQVAGINDIVALDGAPEVAFATIDGAIHVTTDAGTSWERTLDGSFRALAKSPDDVVYVADADGVHELGPDGTSVTTLPGGPTGVDSMTVDPTTGTLYAVRWGVDDDTDGHVGRWDGAAWSQLCLDAECGPGLDRFAAQVAVDPLDPDHLLVATNDLPFHDVIGSVGVLESVDGGATWSPLDDGLTVPRVAMVEFDPHRPGRLVAGTFGGGFFELVRP